MARNFSSPKNTKKKKVYWFSQGFTLMVVPDNNEATFRVRFHKNFLFFTVALFVALIVLSVLTLVTYRDTLHKRNKQFAQSDLLGQELWLHRHYQKLAEEKLSEFKNLGENFYTEIWPDSVNEKDLIATMDQNTNNNFSLKNKVLRLDKVLDFLTVRETSYQKIPLGWPLRTGRVTSPFGRRISPFGYSIDFHSGTDFAAAPGTPIYATAGGKVIFSGTRRDGYGYQVRIEHDYGFITLYGHCSKVLVKADQYVKRGDVVALLGMTGSATGPHVHYEVRLRKKDNFSTYEVFLNPWPFAREKL